MSRTSGEPLLRVADLRIAMATRGAAVPLVRGVDFAVTKGHVLGIAGESGSGKTLTMLALLGLLPRYMTRTGTAEFAGTNLLALSERRLRHVRGRAIGIVFQDPGASLHPMLTVGQQLTEHMQRHLPVSRAEARERAASLLERVRIPDGGGALKRHPHEFSGGMRQRIAIAMALACEPALLIADEPTTALDVTVQAGILRLLRELSREQDVAVILITHDLGVLASIADEVGVMYAGRLVESGTVHHVLQRTRHPYTDGLLRSRAGSSVDRGFGRGIPGAPPNPRTLPSGCAFHPRCEFAGDECTTTLPELTVVTDDHRSACLVDPLPDVESKAAAG